MAMFKHGLRRFTEDVDVLVSQDGMRRVREHLEGLGFVAPAGTTTKLRDVANGVRIEFLISGAFPGDGKPKPIAFPDPADVGIEMDGIRYINLPALIELKLASGISAPHRLKDLADVQEVIRALKLTKDFNQQLHPYVRPKFIELWEALAAAGEEP
jgi:hypothetical protein